MNENTNENTIIQSLEAGAWWIVRRGTHLPTRHDRDADQSSVTADADLGGTVTPYPPRYVGYGRIQSVVEADEILGLDAADDHPIISDAAVRRLGTLAGVTVTRVTP